MCERLKDEVEAENSYLRRDLIANVSHDLRTPLVSMRGYLEDAGQPRRRPVAGAAPAVPGHRGAAERTPVDAGRRTVRAGQARLQGHDAEPRTLRVRRAGRRRAAQVPAGRRGQAGGAACRFAAAPALRRRRPGADGARARQPGRQCAAAHAAGRPRERAVACRRRAHAGQGGGHRQGHRQRRVAVHLRPLLPRRATRTRGDAATGAGLGLAIAKRILELHDSDIAVESGAAGGTSFVFSLPLCAAATGGG